MIGSSPGWAGMVTVMKLLRLVDLNGDELHTKGGIGRSWVE